MCKVFAGVSCTSESLNHFLVPIGTTALCRRREPAVFVCRPSAASGMCAIGQSFIGRNWVVPCRGCGFRTNVIAPRFADAFEADIQRLTPLAINCHGSAVQDQLSLIS